MLEVGLETGSQGQGQFCYVVGNAGMGKSRLVYEFTRALGHVPVFTVQASYLRAHAALLSLPRALSAVA